MGASGVREWQRHDNRVKFSKEKRILAGLALTFGVLILLQLIMLGSATEQKKAGVLAAQTLEVREKLNRLVSYLSDSETAKRGYVLSGQDRYLIHFQNAIQGADRTLIQLRALTQKDPSQRAACDRLEPLIQQRLAISTNSIKARQEGGLDVSTQIQFMEQGQQALEPIRLLVSEMISEEERLFKEREDFLNRNVKGTEGFVVLVSTLSLGLFTVLFIMSVRVVRLRRQAEQVLQSTNFELEQRVKERTAELSRTVEKLAEADEFRGKVMESAVFGLGALDLQGRFTLVNRQFSEFMGYAAEELIGKPYSILLSAENDAALRPLFLRVVQERQAVSRHEIEVLRKDGSRANVIFSWNPLVTQGEVHGVVGTVLDITDFKKMEEALRESERRFRLIIETALDAVITINGEGMILDWNRQAEKIFGWSRHEALGRRLSETIIPPRHRDAHERGLKHFAQTGQGTLLNRRIEVQALNRAGTELTVELAITSLRSGRSIGFSSFVRDITERKRAEEALARERNLLRTLIDNLPAYVYLKDTSGRFVINNQANVRALKAASEAETLGKTVFDFFPEEVARLYHADDQQVLQTGRPLLEREVLTWDYDGQQAWLLTTKLPLRDGHNTITGLLGISLDITERKRAGEILRESQQRFRTLAESLPHLIWTCHADGQCDYLSRQWLEYTGSPMEEQLGFGWAEKLHPEDRDYVRTAWAKTVESGAEFNVEFRIRRHDGAYRWFRTRAVPMRDRDGRIVKWFGSNTDIEDYKRADQTLQTQLERLNLLDQITRAIGQRQDLKSVFQVVSEHLEDRWPIDFGCVCFYDDKQDSLTVAGVGRKSRALALALALPQEASINVSENGLTRFIGGQLIYEPDLSRLPAPFAQRLAHAGLHSLVAAPLLVESNIFGVLVAARRQPEGFSSGDCEFLRQLSEHVALAAHQTQLYDVLQQAYQELRETQQAVMQQERLRALGQMASGIAHDINNAIAPAALYTESLLAHEPNLSAQAREQLETIEHALDDVAATVARMREFYRQRPSQLPLVPVALNSLVQQVVNLSRARWSDMPQQRGHVIRLETELAPDLPCILGVEAEIRGALTNLVFNAVDAMPAGGKLILRTGIVSPSADSKNVETPTHVHVEVTDTGVGMDDETRRRCLEPFFTTKGERGTGLGLAMVYGTMQRHDAAVEITSASGQGTTVRLVFPLRTAAAAGTAKFEAASVKLPCLRVLVIDDDSVLLKSLRDALEVDGHIVTTASGGQIGLDTFRAALASDEHFAAVITDLGMPDVDGRKVAVAIKQASPATPVILLTGWGQRLTAEGDIPAEVDCLLNKPAKLHELREALARCCQQGES
jgi:PAS domain S-box-containing protein